MSLPTSPNSGAILRIADWKRQLEPRKGGFRTSTWEAIPTFWRFQILGWVAWTIWAMPLSFHRHESISTAFWLGISQEFCGFALTLLLRDLYSRPWIRYLGVWLVALMIVICSVIAAAINLAFVGVLVQLLSLAPEGSLKSPSLELLFCLRTLVFVAWSALYFSIRGLIKMEEESRRLVEAERLRHDAELQMLRSQTNPHFLFNAFNTILSEGRGNPKVIALVKGLSDYLRYSLACRHEGFVSLGAEIDAIASYLEVEKMRFQDNLILDISVTQMARSAGVPGVIIQPLIENAIKYGRETSEYPLRIRIAAETGPHALRIEVSNSGHWIEPHSYRRNHPSGTGLDNLRRRLDAIYPGTHRFEIGPRGDEVVALVEIQMHHDYDQRLQNYELRQRMEPS